MDIFVNNIEREIDTGFSYRVIFIIFIVITLLVAFLFWLYLNIVASMQVQAQNADIRLPQSLAVKIDINNGLDAHAIGEVSSIIPIQQTFNLPLQGTYPAHLAFNVTTPVRVDIDYKTDILIDTIMPLNATTDLVYESKLLPKFPLKVDIPLRLIVPFHLKRSYQVPIDIDFNGPVKLEMNENLKLNIDHQFKPQLVLEDAIEMHNISRFNAVMENVETQTQADINMQIDLPLTAIRH